MVLLLIAGPRNRIPQVFLRDFGKHGDIPDWGEEQGSAGQIPAIFIQK